MGLLDKLLSKSGAKVTKAPSEDQTIRETRHKRLQHAWAYLRQTIDQGINQYFDTGSTEMLRTHMESPALERLEQQLQMLADSGVRWSQPNRKKRTQAAISVIDEIIDQRGLPQEFTVQEEFNDYSLLEQHDQGRKVAEVAHNGERRIFQATVVVRGPQDYRVKDIRRVVVPSPYAE